MTEHYDLIVIGSGPGGASLAQALAPSGKRILILERGDYLPREKANWSAQAVFVDGPYQANETWIGADGGAFSPQLHYYVGGNSRVYGSALFRLRDRDLDEIAHAGGVSPAWPLKYRDFAPYYDAAEALFQVHGARGEDPTEPPAATPYPHRAVKHEPKVAQLSDKLKGIGLKPFHLPLGILLDQKEDGFATPTSTCIRCTAFDGFPCLLNGKADAQVICIDPMLAKHDNITLMTNAYVAKLGTDASGRRVDDVHVERNGKQEIYSSATVVVACGSLSSALLLLRSAGDNLVALVDQNGRVETESVDASGDRPHLDPAMLARIARISPEGADRNQRQFSDAFGAFDFRSSVRIPAWPRSRRLTATSPSVSYAGVALARKVSDLATRPD